uniref:Uncharacterized protein n=1 Tax=Arundo donax TaxID=35708 RepID=A0A0A9ATD8_ARUDO
MIHPGIRFWTSVNDVGF